MCVLSFVKKEGDKKKGERREKPPKRGESKRGESKRVSVHSKLLSQNYFFLEKKSYTAI